MNHKYVQIEANGNIEGQATVPSDTADRSQATSNITSIHNQKPFLIVKLPLSSSIPGARAFVREDDYEADNEEEKEFSYSNYNKQATLRPCQLGHRTFITLAILLLYTVLMHSKDFQKILKGLKKALEEYVNPTQCGHLDGKANLFILTTRQKVYYLGLYFDMFVG